LIIAYGPEILGFLIAAIHNHRPLTFSVIGAIVAVIVLVVWLFKSRTRQRVEISVA